MYNFLVWPGNNSELIRKALERRPHFSDVVGCLDKREDETEAQWRQRCSRRVTDVKAAFEAQEFHVLWRPTLRVRVGSQGQSVTVHSPPLPAGRRQLVNHFPQLKALVTKTGICRSLDAYYALLETHVHDVTPTTFVVRNDDTDDAWQGFVRHFSALAQDPGADCERMPAKHCATNLWLIKPAASNQGRGIQVLAELSRIKQYLFTQPNKGEWVIQKYIERPLLFFGRKFDIRVWVLVTDTLDVFLYREGYLRTSSETFSTDLRRGAGDKGDAALVHLTNYCMQKHGPNIGRFEDGNTVSYAQFQEYLDSEQPDDGVSLVDDVLPRLETQILDAVLAVQDTLGTKGAARGSFELFGYDFMLDEDYRAYLIEVNTNPFLGEQNPWHGELVARMTEDLVALAVDPVFPGPSSAASSVDQAAGNGFKMLHRGEHAPERPGFTPPPELAVRRLGNRRTGPTLVRREGERTGNWWYPKNGAPLFGDDENNNPARFNPFDKAADAARKRVLAYRRAAPPQAPSTGGNTFAAEARWGSPRKPPVPRLSLTVPAGVAAAAAAAAATATDGTEPPSPPLISQQQSSSSSSSSSEQQPQQQQQQQPETANVNFNPFEPRTFTDKMNWAVSQLDLALTAAAERKSGGDDRTSSRVALPRLEAEEDRARLTPTPPPPGSARRDAWGAPSHRVVAPPPPEEEEPQRPRVSTALRCLLRIVAQRPTSIASLAEANGLVLVWDLATHPTASQRHRDLAVELLQLVLQHARQLELQRAPLPLPHASVLVAASLPPALKLLVLERLEGPSTVVGAEAPTGVSPQERQRRLSLDEGPSATDDDELSEEERVLQGVAIQLLTYAVRWRKSGSDEDAMAAAAAATERAAIVSCGSVAVALALSYSQPAQAAARRAARVLLSSFSSRELPFAVSAVDQWPAYLRECPSFVASVTTALQREQVVRASARRRREERSAKGDVEGSLAKAEEERRLRAAEWTAEQERVAAKRRERMQLKRQQQEKARAAEEEAQLAREEEERKRRLEALNAKLREQKRRKREEEKLHRQAEEAELERAQQEMAQRQEAAQAMRLQWLRRKVNEKREQERLAAERLAEAHSLDEEERLRRQELTQHRNRRREQRDLRRKEAIKQRARQEKELALARKPQRKRQLFPSLSEFLTT